MFQLYLFYFYQERLEGIPPFHQRPLDTLFDKQTHLQDSTASHTEEICGARSKVRIVLSDSNV